MNNPNPFVPQGSLLEQHKRRSRMKLAVFCTFALSAAGLIAMLIQGCKREQTGSEAENQNPNQFVETNPPMVETQPPLETNPVVVAASNPPSMGTVPPLEPVSPVVPPVQPTPTAIEYVVVKGDTLGGIAHKYHISIKALENANPNIEPTRLQIGQKLTIPAPPQGAASTTASQTMSGASNETGTSMGGEIYVVKSGDTLTKIARQYHTTIRAIEEANNLTTTKIKVGQKLKIPAKVETPTTTVNNPPPESATIPSVQPQSNAPSGQ